MRYNPREDQVRRNTQPSCQAQEGVPRDLGAVGTDEHKKMGNREFVLKLGKSLH
jgi:hypothetical protein